MPAFFIRAMMTSTEVARTGSMTELISGGVPRPDSSWHPRYRQHRLAFRHSYSTLLRGAHVDLKVQQELLRHSTIQSTINIYTRAVPKEKRTANRLVVGSLLRAQNWKSASVTVAN
jgi:hypothetical protein